MKLDKDMIGTIQKIAGDELSRIKSDLSCEISAHLKATLWESCILPQLQKVLEKEAQEIILKELKGVMESAKYNAAVNLFRPVCENCGQDFPPMAEDD